MTTSLGKNTRWDCIRKNGGATPARGSPEHSKHGPKTRFTVGRNMGPATESGESGAAMRSAMLADFLLVLQARLSVLKGAANAVAEDGAVDRNHQIMHGVDHEGI